MRDGLERSRRHDSVPPRRHAQRRDNVPRVRRSRNDRRDLGGVVLSEREQALVFGEVAEQYDEARPGYPDAVFDAIMEFGALQPGDRALEIGAGTGKATLPFVARGLDITALEPSAGMAAVLQGKGVDVVEERFDTYAVPQPFRLLFGAQSWHWVLCANRHELASAALESGGT